MIDADAIPDSAMTNLEGPSRKLRFPHAAVSLIESDIPSHNKPPRVSDATDYRAAIDIPRQLAMRTTYSADNGQVFREWTVRGHPITGAGDNLDDWSRRRPYPLFNDHGSKGPRSLVDMAIRVIANNIGGVTPAHCEMVPSTLLWRIWRFLQARGVNIHAWKLFSSVLLNEDEDRNLALYRFREHICQPREPLKQYIEPMSSISVDFITHIVISGGCDFGTHELLCLADMRNLGVLELVQPADDINAAFPEISDRLLRGWTEKDRPFPLLRILRIWGFDAVTDDSLHHVAKFPSLSIYDVKGAREDWKSVHAKATREGWEVMADSHRGLSESLLRYLMLFAPLDEAPDEKVIRTIESDLVSLCSDSLCSVQFMPEDKAPALMDFLTENARAYVPSWDVDAHKRNASGCYGAPFEAWAFWLYSFIGQLSRNRDLKTQGATTTPTGAQNAAVIGPFILPSKPFASLFLGHNFRGGITTTPAYVSRGLFSTKSFTFTRPSVVSGGGASMPEPTAAARATTYLDTEFARASLTLKPQKRKRLDDVLQGFLR